MIRLGVGDPVRGALGAGAEHNEAVAPRGLSQGLADLQRSPDPTGSTYVQVGRVSVLLGDLLPLLGTLSAFGAGLVLGAIAWRRG